MPASHRLDAAVVHYEWNNAARELREQAAAGARGGQGIAGAIADGDEPRLPRILGAQAVARGRP